MMPAMPNGKQQKMVVSTAISMLLPGFGIMG